MDISPGRSRRSPSRNQRADRQLKENIDTIATANNFFITISFKTF
jgi:hypothetical protein